MERRPQFPGSVLVLSSFLLSGCRCDGWSTSWHLGPERDLENSNKTEACIPDHVTCQPQTGLTLTSYMENKIRNFSLANVTLAKGLGEGGCCKSFQLNPVTTNQFSFLSAKLMQPAEHPVFSGPVNSCVASTAHRPCHPFLLMEGHLPWSAVTPMTPSDSPVLRQ